MKVKRALALGMATTVAALCATGGSALAAFPNFSDCPPVPGGGVCIDIQSNSGELVIKGFHVPLGHSLEIRGGVNETSNSLIPPRGTNGFFAEPVDVPGGLLGIDLPIWLNEVTATAELAGPASSIVIEGFQIRMPLKVHLSNPLIGSNCYIGSNRSPVNVTLITGTTNPPAPNTPISGQVGTPSFIPPDTFSFTGGVNVDNAFSIPGASGCGLGLGLINGAINLKLGLPSAAGNNALTIQNNVALKQVEG